MKNGLFLSILLTITLLPKGNAQTWNSALYLPSWQPPVTKNFYNDQLIQDFSYAGYHRGEKVVDRSTEKIVDVTRAPYYADNTGGKDVTAILQQAINDAAGDTMRVVIFLPKGTYKVSPVGDNDFCLEMLQSNRVLRGDGTGKTYILNASVAMRSKAIIRVGGGDSWASERKGKTRIMHDQLTPTKTIPVENAGEFKKGDLVIVRNYINNDWINQHQMLPYWKDKGNSLGGLLYCREIMAVNYTNNELTIDIPIRYALEKAHGAVVYKAPLMITEVGIEHLSIGNQQSMVNDGWKEEDYHQAENGAYQCHDSWVIAMSQVVNGWIDNVASYQPKGNTAGTHILSNGIKVSHTKNVSILNCKFSYPQFGGGGGNGYMYRIMGNETLMQDCIADFNRHGFVMSQMACSGNVFLRCTDKNSGRQTGLTGYEKTNGSGSDHHMHFSQSNLFDQCIVENSFFAAGWRKWGGSTIHGLTAAHSVYWNITSNGAQASAVETQQSRYGYVIGTSGNKPAVKTSAWAPGTELITNPVDFTEGLGKGQQLQPQSLYLDQKLRRLKAVN